MVGHRPSSCPSLSLPAIHLSPRIKTSQVSAVTGHSGLGEKRKPYSLLQLQDKYMSLLSAHLSAPLCRLGQAKPSGVELLGTS